jgi:hypothetical protein
LCKVLIDLIENLLTDLDLLMEKLFSLVVSVLIEFIFANLLAKVISFFLK